MSKPVVFNYQDHERLLEENKKLKEDIANLQIRCRIAESEKPDRDCKNCKHNKPDGCSRWECEYEPVMVELVRCKDCKHHHMSEMYSYCDVINVKGRSPMTIDFCSYAERREP